MQGTKVVIWVVAVALAATALMFGAASLIRAGSSRPDVAVVESVTDGQARTEYVRVCERHEWENVRRLYRAANMTSGLMSDGQNVTPIYVGLFVGADCGFERAYRQILVRYATPYMGW